MRLMTVLWWAAIPLSCGFSDGGHQGKSSGDFKSFQGKPPPELVSSPSHWMNAGDAVTLAGLRGRVVWLQFNF